MSETLSAVTDAVTGAVTGAVTDVPAIADEIPVTLSSLRHYGFLRLNGAALPLFLTVAVLCILLGYFLGSVNFAVVISRVKFHDDIRKYGSGNAGATNMMRTYGRTAGFMTLFGDIMKGVVTVSVAQLLCGESAAYLAGFACLLGHTFPCYYKFKGGKGVAVTASMALVLEPLAFLILFAAFVIIVAFTKYISLGSVFAALMYPLVIYNTLKSRYGSAGIPVLVALVICVLIVYFHRENIRRLLAGQENKFSFSKKK